MSHTTIKPASSGEKPSLEDFVDLGRKLVLTSIENFRAVMLQTQALMPQSSLPRSTCPCDIPEVECPPRCVCNVSWVATPGESLMLNIRLTNSSRIPRNFALLATPFQGSSASPGTITVAPASLALAAGQTGIATATFAVPTTASEGNFEAEIVIRGAYEQAICVSLQIQCKQICGEHCGACHVVQGDPPVRIRAHQWYHHFQCSEPCIRPQ